jgi:hypothetical protein
MWPRGVKRRRSVESESGINACAGGALAAAAIIAALAAHGRPAWLAAASAKSGIKNGAGGGRYEAAACRRQAA